MLTVNAQTLSDLITSNWGWASGLALSMVALTVAAGSLLNQERKDEIALWLMGAQTEDNWSRTFTSLFDAVFGNRHLSFKCFSRSAIASLIAVAVLWLFMGEGGALAVRIQSELTLGSILVIALAVNVVADYISLLETRLILGQLHRVQSIWTQLIILLLDLLFSTAIIWLAILAYLNSPLHAGEVDTFAEIIGVFSIFSVIFYSTFLTSVWSWAFFISTWIMRALNQLRVVDWMDIETKPIHVLSVVLGGAVFLCSFAISMPLQKDHAGLTVIDRSLCSLFKGQVCINVAKLTKEERAKFDLILTACEGGITKVCLDRGFATYQIKPTDAAKLWNVACQAGEAASCMSLGWLHQNGHGMTRNVQKAARLYRMACDAGEILGCNNLANLIQDGIVVSMGSVDNLYQKSCDSGLASSCNELASLYSTLWHEGDQELRKAAKLYKKACDWGDAAACRLYHDACKGGTGAGCNNLRILGEKTLAPSRTILRCEDHIVSDCNALKDPS